MNYAEKIKFVNSMVEVKKLLIFYLTTSKLLQATWPKICFIGLPIFYVSLITGVSIEEIND
jgi:hypothetical protein